MRTRYAMLGLLAIPLVDALLLVVVADRFLGWQATVALVVLTGLVGMLLVRAEGRHTLRRLQEKSARGEPPTDELLDGAFLIAAGAFLLTPGLVTDTIGFLLALPVTRYPLRALLKRYVVVPYLDDKMDGFVTGGVWTGGFPGPDGTDDSGGMGGTFGGPNDGFGGGSGGSSGGGSGGSSGGDDVYDVDGDSYRVDDDNR